MAFDDEVKRHADKVFGLLAINITAKAVRASVTIEEFINVNRQAGVGDDEIKSLLFNDLRVGGRIFGEFFNALKQDVKGRMGDLVNGTFDIRIGTKEKKKWIAVSDDPCPDCEPRHGEIDTDTNWELRGKPRSGWSVCRTNCKCKLIPLSQIEKHGDILEPIKLGD